MTHPLVGVWIAEVDDATRSRVTHAFRDDGTVLVASAFHAAQGIWRPTGERTAELVVMRPIEGEGRRFVGWQRALGSVEVSGDGSGYVMVGMISRPLPDGGFEEQQANVTGIRLTLG
jgi:hypothetical protein